MLHLAMAVTPAHILQSHYILLWQSRHITSCYGSHVTLNLVMAVMSHYILLWQSCHITSYFSLHYIFSLHLVMSVTSDYTLLWQSRHISSCYGSHVTCYITSCYGSHITRFSPFVGDFGSLGWPPKFRHSFWDLDIEFMKLYLWSLLWIQNCDGPYVTFSYIYGTVSYNVFCEWIYVWKCHVWSIAQNKVPPYQSEESNLKYQIEGWNLGGHPRLP